MPAEQHPESILIVDDDRNNCEILTLRLQTAGYSQIRVAHNGANALKAVARGIPDLILLDVMMPGTNGYTVTEQVRARYPDQFIPIILLSALHEPADRARGIRAGADDFISKPFDAHELLARVQSLLAHKHTRDELQAREQRLSLLYEISQSLAGELDHQKIIDRIMVETLSLTGASKAILALVDQEGVFQQKVVARPGEPARRAETIDPVVMREGLLGRVIQTGVPVLIGDVESDARWTKSPDDDEPAASVVAVPLVRGERVSGALMLVSPDSNAFQPEHQELLLALGSQAAIALEKARLLAQANEERARVEALLTQIGNPVLVTDPAGAILSANPAAIQTLRLEGDIIGRAIGDVFGLSVADLLTRAGERGAAVSGEFTLRRKAADERRNFNVSVSPIQSVGFILFWQDITPIKEGERARLDSERAETQRVLHTFSRYMSPALVERILEDRDILTRRERREAVVMFADLRGFTRLTSEHPADAVMGLLNDFFTEMIEIVNQNEGLVFDIVGDELMIVFNAPYDQPEASPRALQTAVAMQRRFAEIKRGWAERDMLVGLGIGINRGMIVLGHIGGRSYMRYSMVGEAVNIAHRLMEMAEDTQIVVTPDVLTDGIPDSDGVTLEERPPVTLKGKTSPLSISVLAVADSAASPVR